MDTLRGNFGSGDYADDHRDYDPSEDEPVRETPPPGIGQDERRMQVRAYNHWASLLADRNFPSIEDLDPYNLPDFGPYSVVLDFTAGIENPAIQFLGDKLAKECGADDGIESLDDVPSRSLLSRITDHYMQILANQAPIGFEAEFVNQRGATILYRGILLPFSSDDDTIDFIYGVINWKEMADQLTADELLLEIDQALEADDADAAPRMPDPVTDWADGPATEEDGSIADLPLDEELEEGFAEDDESEDDLPAPSFGLSAMVAGEEDWDEEDEEEDDSVFAPLVLDPSYEAPEDFLSPVDDEMADDWDADAAPLDTFDDDAAPAPLPEAYEPLAEDMGESEGESEGEHEAAAQAAAFEPEIEAETEVEAPETESAAEEVMPVASFPDAGDAQDEAVLELADVFESDDELGLYDSLAVARELAMAARSSEDRTRVALYDAVGRAYDFSIAAQHAPDEFEELVAENGLTVQDRAPMTPVVKLVFGADYDKTRLTEYAAVLTHGHRLGIARGELASFLRQHDGGLKGVVAAERRLRREEAGKELEPVDGPREAIARKLRKIEPAGFDAIASDGPEFGLVMIRRMPDGSVMVVGEVPEDVPLLERAARKILA